MNKLSKKQEDILNMILAGASNKAISDQICISQKTVECHISKIMEKMNIDVKDKNIHPRVKLCLAWKFKKIYSSKRGKNE